MHGQQNTKNYCWCCTAELTTDCTFHDNSSRRVIQSLIPVRKSWPTENAKLLHAYIRNSIMWFTSARRI